ncbi:MAG: hypothetical protein OHK0036_06500 [Bacteroidia bacterium]
MRKIYVVPLISVFLFYCSKNKDITHPIKKDIVQAVYASGKIYPVNVYNVYSKLPGYIAKIHVQAGDNVKAGQVLITIRSEATEKNLEIARNQFKLASINISDNSPILKSLQEEVKNAYTKYSLDSSTFQKYQQLWKNNATTQLLYEQAKSQADISKQNYFKALNNFQQTKNQLKIEYENARLQFEALQSNWSEYQIVSAIEGKVYDILPKEGELVNSTALLMVIGDAHQFEVELQIDETDINYLKLNQKIVYQTDAYPDKIFSGEVKKIFQRINPVNKTCRAIGSIQSDNYAFFSGMSVEANIIVSEKKQALVIPKNYLYNNQYVITSKNDTIKIKKGVEDLEYVEITDGVNETTEIIRP